MQAVPAPNQIHVMRRMLQLCVRQGGSAAGEAVRMTIIPARLEGETDLNYLRRKELCWGLWQGDALERISQQDQTIDALRARVSELTATLTGIKDLSQTVARLVVDGMADLTPDMHDRDYTGHINIMAAHGDPDYQRGSMSCRHVDTRSIKPRKTKEKTA